MVGRSPPEKLGGTKVTSEGKTCCAGPRDSRGPAGVGKLSTEVSHSVLLTGSRAPSDRHPHVTLCCSPDGTRSSGGKVRKPMNVGARNRQATKSDRGSSLMLEGLGQVLGTERAVCLEPRDREGLVTAATSLRVSWFGGLCPPLDCKLREDRGRA